MPRFYIRQYINGQQMAKDQKGREFANAAEACTYAVRRAPGLLRKIMRPQANTFLSTEVSDGERTRFIIRGKVTSEKH
ncbi:hypothetical protein ABID58_007496 [Bradyrhizobium sp. S3.2.6]|uniref:DUF6894 family protein n=1 Tax=Bradyrhizobium sp. S3.2.6 TaxID=3156428 RepID=UPI003395DA3A